MSEKNVNAKSDDRSEAHLQWLVENRSLNQKVTLELYIAIKRNSDTINSDMRYALLAQELAAIAFSLWRAVFLSDLTEDVEKQMIDVETFLANLVSHNSIGYPQDRNAREWTFQYYLGDARQRLLSVASRPPTIIAVDDIETEAHSAKEDWSIAQRALAKAVQRFGELTEPTHEPPSPPEA